MKIDRISDIEAHNRVRSMTGIALMLSVGSHTATSPKWQVMVCDYTKLAGYEVKFQVAIYDKDGHLKDRFNVV